MKELINGTQEIKKKIGPEFAWQVSKNKERNSETFLWPRPDAVTNGCGGRAVEYGHKQRIIVNKLESSHLQFVFGMNQRELHGLPLNCC